MNQFTARYKTLSNADLLKIIDTPADYQPEAVEAANDELAARTLVDDELFAAREKNEALKQEQLLKSAKTKALQNKAQDIVYTITDTLNPIQSEKPSAPKAILWISILMILLTLYQLYSQFGLLKYMFTYGSANWSFDMVMYFFRPLIVAPIAAVLFALRQKYGWVLLSGYFIYLAVNTLALFYIAFKHPAQPGEPLPPATVSSLLGWAIFNAGCLYFMFKKDVREIYNISTKDILMSAGFGVLLTLSSIVG
ncbi:MAG: hypothetical protein ABI113_21320 [Mucilaginibacter sp.]